MCESSKFIFVVPIQCVPFAAADDFATWITPVILKDDLGSPYMHFVYFFKEGLVAISPDEDPIGYGR